MTRHLILCGGLEPCQGENGQKHQLTIADVPGGIDLRVEQLQRQMVSEIPDIPIDLLDIAAYVYAADSKVRRGGPHMKHVGAQWRRQFQFAIPVRSLGMRARVEALFLTRSSCSPAGSIRFREF